MPRNLSSGGPFWYAEHKNGKWRPTTEKSSESSTMLIPKNITYTPEQNQQDAEQYCRDLNNPAKYRTSTCKECGGMYVISTEERRWFEDRKLAVPRRCTICRGRQTRKKKS